MKFGGPSADNRNLRARVDGTGTYRVTGNVGSAFDVLFTAAAGDMALGQTGVSHERSASEFDVLAERINCGNAAFRRQFDEQPTISEVHGFFGHQKRIHSILLHRIKDALVLCLVNGAT